MSLAAAVALLLAVPAAHAQNSVQGGRTRPQIPVTTQTQGRLGLGAAATYDNKYEIYGGLNFMNFQAGQSLPKRMNFGGAEVLGSYWITPRIGLGADFRGEAGTSPVLPNAYNINRALVYEFMGMGGAQFRGPRNRYAGVNVHAYGGIAHATFDSATSTFPAISSPTQVGLYNNSTSPVAALGGSVDFNYSKNVAIRVQPDLMLEHFGTELREFFAVSGGVVFRIGKR